ncbi:E3 ubiquitin-protein ligase RNF213-like [Dreissena polymorpha]|uniref:E3 ubiquitin-protein ligase RNF213-like n=1 Tax=Dreissena polymorpha TaxID=45954 RepID=UPI002263CCBE|nr:E3 ubiquitin-protein ligase RNF213-like [Dreissena polymorpha]
MYMHEKTKPLPSADEVLLCDSKTTGEEVEIFWRRALFGDGNKIYSLVNADVLPYDVSSDADQSLQDLISGTNTRAGKQYRLAIICGSDNEYRCPFVSSLDKYVRPTPTIQQEAVQAYIEAKLVVQNHLAASIVDFKRCSVRVVKSNRAGVGKSLYIKRKAEGLKTKLAAFVNVQTEHVSIPLQEKFINTHEVTHALLKYTSRPELQTARLFHIDISHEVQEGIDIFLFNLLILGCLVDNNGHVWRRSRNDLYMIEAMPIMKNNMSSGRAMVLQFEHPIFAILPAITCTSPQQSLQIYQGEISKGIYANMLDI